MLADWHKDFPRHVAAFLRTWGLIFYVDTGSTLFDEQLCQLHDRGQSAVPRIRIGNDWAKEIGVCDAASTRFRCAKPFLPLLPVMEELCHEEMLYLVGHRRLHIELVMLSFMGILISAESP